MTSKIFKRLISVFLSLSILFSLFVFSAALPVLAAGGNMIVWENAPAYSRLLYRPSTGDFAPGGQYELSFDFNLTAPAVESRAFAVYYCNKSDSFVRISHDSLDIRKTALLNGFHYEIIFTVPADCRTYYNILFKFGDVTVGGYKQTMRLANPTLYLLCEDEKVSGIELSIPKSLADISEVSTNAQKTNGIYGSWVCPQNFLKNINVTPQSDYFDVKPGDNRIAGDINGDGAVNNKDLTRLFQYLSDWDVEVNRSALDINGDTAFNNRDLTRLFQYLSGWDVQIFYDWLYSSNKQEDNMTLFSNSSGYDASKVFTGGAAAEADQMRQKILNAANTEEIYNITGNKYYIKKGESVSTIPENLSAGDAVLFQRGGIWRINETTLTVPAGVIFGAYGEGEKPRFYGSAKNYAKPGVWTNEGDNIWSANLKGGNAGIMVFNEIYALGVKKWEKSELAEYYDFYSDNDKIYFYCTEDPATVFKSIEIGQRSDVINVKSGAVLDNVCVRYTGAHGVAVGGGSENISITNCEVSLLGGSRQHGETRYGNGIELQLGVKNVTVKNNYVYQCYDAGITFQSWNSADMDTYYDGVVFDDNLIENCFYNIEFFSTQPDRGGHYTEMHNISMRNNILRFAGYCWSYEQRPGHWMTANIRSSQRGWYEETENFVIADNIFDCSRACLVYWWWHSTDDSYVYDAPHPGVIVSGNTFYETNTIDGRVMGYRYELAKNAYDLAGLKKAVAVFDPAPKKVVWLDKI